MKYLIDTHILIWLAISPEKISKDILFLLENKANEVYVSTVSFWEIAIKLSIKKLDLHGIGIDDLAAMCDEQDIKIVQLPISAIRQYRILPMKANHKDPFDRALISLSISDNYILLTHDEKMEQYKEDGLICIC
ncbi:MAG: type II toxin-antitoxin system VapC family toxin [Spirochaetales bacterium]|nr:type II toxin-antitoxin system VapC family toxin [Spirochaetales bacterium]MBR3732495.1 type II toxin-antitoxin system VapC family toxin [Spirochaetales bacterium]MBR6198740.1 type II toxin-antitoxin system VapC family toxin [Spirochaetales bacterium]